MLEALLGSRPDLESIKRLISARTGGNPFFIEEMVQALFEQGIPARNGEVKLVRPLAQAHLPVTVQCVIAAPIDQLSAKDKELLSDAYGNRQRIPVRACKTGQPNTCRGLETGFG